MMVSSRRVNRLMTNTEEVSSRITGAITDLHVADSLYHQTCYTTFVSSRNIATPVASISKLQKPDHIYLSCSCVVISKYTSNYVQLYDVYSKSLKADEGIEYDYTGTRCAYSNLIQKLQEHVGECLIVLRTEVCANIIAFSKHVSEKLKLLEANDADAMFDTGPYHFSQ